MFMSNKKSQTTYFWGRILALGLLVSVISSVAQADSGGLLAPCHQQSDCNQGLFCSEGACKAGNGDRCYSHNNDSSCLSGTCCGDECTSGHDCDQKNPNHIFK